jgi:hypothetical protein
LPWSMTGPPAAVAAADVPGPVRPCGDRDAARSRRPPARTRKLLKPLTTASGQPECADVA